MTVKIRVAFLLVLVLAMPILLQSCFLICGPRAQEHYLSAKEKNILPYHDGQQLHFKRNDGAHLTFTVKRSYTKTETGIGKEWCIGLIKFDIDSVLFETADRAAIFPALLVFPGEVSSSLNGIRFFAHNIYKDNGDQVVLPYDKNINFICGVNSLGGTVRCIGQMDLNGVRYDDIYEISTNSYSDTFVGTNTIRACDIFYSQTKGILKVGYTLFRDDIGNGEFVEYSIE